ncbi:MAG TPA: hypothetical protein VLE02_01045 [Nitrosarchaeum sp.]|nr:hypothetical protein [Nitrosarchaeum sp.]
MSRIFDDFTSKFIVSPAILSSKILKIKYRYGLKSYCITLRPNRIPSSFRIIEAVNENFVDVYDTLKYYMGPFQTNADMRPIFMNCTNIKILLYDSSLDEYSVKYFSAEEKICC